MNDTPEELRQIAQDVDWPARSSTGHPLCDRCDAPATRVAYSTPDSDSACFFCEECDEHDAI